MIYDIKLNYIIKELSDDYFDFNYSSTEEIALVSYLVDVETCFNILIKILFVHGEVV